MVCSPLIYPCLHSSPADISRNEQLSEPLDFQFATEFPIRSVTALRVCILEPKVARVIYRAAWSTNQPISSDEVLAKVLTEGGFNGKKLVMDVTTGSKASLVKQALKDNTDEAIKLGICGVWFLFLFLTSPLVLTI